MSQKSANRKVKRMVFKRLDQIVNGAKSICKSWEIKRIPLGVLNEILDKNKFPLTTKDKFVLNHERKFNETLVLLKKIFKTESKRVGDGKLAISQLKTLIQGAKEGFEIGQKKIQNL